MLWFKSKTARLAELDELISRLKRIVSGKEYSANTTVAMAEKMLKKLETKRAKLA